MKFMKCEICKKEKEKIAFTGNGVCRLCWHDLSKQERDFYRGLPELRKIEKRRNKFESRYGECTNLYKEWRIKFFDLRSGL